MPTLSWLDIALLMLATWRLSYMVVKEDGPRHAFGWLRAHTTLGGLLTCVYCCSVWAALILLFLYFSPLRLVVTLLAISGGALMAANFSGVEYRA